MGVVRIVSSRRVSLASQEARERCAARLKDGTRGKDREKVRRVTDTTCLERTEALGVSFDSP